MSANSKNPASLAAGRVPDTFCLAAERPEDSQTARHFQGSVIGIDPGVAGALALVGAAGDLIEVADMPVLRDGSVGRASVNAPLLAALIALAGLMREGRHV